ncbi:hypothetical protein [Halospeciosus flavus]|uniref:hypothetical protein n=1 Tax=Halospeciosus flavus TaxID=3032283 RepID=UPI00361EDFA5
MSENNHTDSDEFSTLIDDTDEFYTQRVEELMEADGLTKAEARRAALYAMKDGSPFPTRWSNNCSRRRTGTFETPRTSPPVSALSATTPCLWPRPTRAVTSAATAPTTA